MLKSRLLFALFSEEESQAHTLMMQPEIRTSQQLYVLQQERLQVICCCSRALLLGTLCTIGISEAMICTSCEESGEGVQFFFSSLRGDMCRVCRFSVSISLIVFLKKTKDNFEPSRDSSKKINTFKKASQKINDKHKSF